MDVHIKVRKNIFDINYSDYLDGPISYSIPHGDKRGYDIKFFDETYDGYNENGTLKGKTNICTTENKIDRFVHLRWSWSINRWYSSWR
jgi:hypothetical protein